MNEENFQQPDSPVEETPQEKRGGNKMRKLIYGLLVVAVIAVAAASAPAMMNHSESPLDDPGGQDVKREVSGVVPISSPLIFDNFPFPEADVTTSVWTDNRALAIQPPFVSGVLWRPLGDGSGEPRFSHIVIEPFGGNQACIAYYDKVLESSVTAEHLSQAVAMCFDLVRNQRGDGMTNAGSPVDSSFVEAYSREILGVCGNSLEAYNWTGTNVSEEDICEIPSGTQFARSLLEGA